ncbi:MAG: phenylacetate--CoA ligase family protein, partial [candidate division Zixibacteria bacterium]|nr:phenylacetate--CoA ligase family protein [candidate division Zixibacteria bacterium]
NLQIDSIDELKEIERALLSDLFRRILADVPFYQNMPILKTNLSEIDPVSILHMLPLVTKEMIQENAESFTLQSVPRSDLECVTTGGSTALPFGFYDVKRISNDIETAYIHHIWGRVGYHRTESSAVFRGTVVQKPKSKRLWSYDPFRRSMVYSSYHLNGDDLEVIYDHLLKFNPRFIQAYPSAANLLATYIDESGKQPPSNLKALLLASENLPLWQRKRIEKAFDATVYSWYGHAEKAVLAAEIPGRSELHVLPTYGYVYLRSDDGRIIEEPGIPGEIITTGFTTQATQFVNYRTGDIGVWADSHDPSSRVLERVEGRAQELAVTATGRKISMAAINMHTDIFDHVKQFRFVQNRKGAIKMEIVRKSNYLADDEHVIRNGVSEKLGVDMELEISYVNSIPRAKSGKARFLVQKLGVR